MEKEKEENIWRRKYSFLEEKKNGEGKERKIHMKKEKLLRDGGDGLKALQEVIADLLHILHILHIPHIFAYFLFALYLYFLRPCLQHIK